MADAASNGALRPLLPRPPPDQSPAPPPPQSPSTPQKKNVIAACDLSILTVPAQCNGERPSCHECTARQRECVYSTQPAETRVTALKRKHGQLESELERLRNSHLALSEVVEAMKTSNRTDALAILQRIRDGVDIEAVARSISIGDILLQLRVAPETRYRYVFPYRTDMPLSIRKRSDVPYMRSAVYEVMSVTAGPNAEPQETHFGMDDHATPQFYKPYHASAIEDPRLDAVKPSMWTTISDDDDLMRTLLRLYFLHEYHWLSCFCKDHFLDDMLSGKKHFCSSLLVNVILAQACVSFATHNHQV
ncbi:C6 transcription factor [Colletotrichum truncatum]|uniref:C6 transcription factor n=1 Tax=Colletotrichum truncatum TaxID=5467 RepID=A0ACC3YHS5_COLTU